MLTSFFWMEYVDDPINIMGSDAIIDLETDTFVFDDENNQELPLPWLTTIYLRAVINHALMIPYHSPSKFMIGVLDQMKWSNEFLPTK